MKNIYIVRHGETDWNKEGKIQGAEADIPLNNVGKEQAKKLALYVKNYRMQKHNIDCIWTSPLSRAKETAEIIKQDIMIESLIVYNELVETGMGKLSGLNKTDELLKLWDNCKRNNKYLSIEKDEEMIYRMKEANNMLNIGIENHELIVNRCAKIIKEIKASIYNNIIIVTHSGFINVLLSYIYNIPESIIKGGGNCSISYHQYDSSIDRFKMISGQNNHFFDNHF